MEGPAIVGDYVPPPPRPLSSLVPYNISLNLSSIFAMLPGSRFLARLRRGAYEIQIDPSEIPTASMVAEWASEASQQDTGTPRAELTQESIQVFPGPWGFFTSGYIVGLFVMAILLHRMQNVIIPSRVPARRARHAYRFGPTFATPFQPHTVLLQRLYALILPLDFARTTTRLMLHLPSLYYLAKMLLIWVLLVLQTCEIVPAAVTEKDGWWGALGFLESLMKWSSEKDMSEICWSTFCAVCCAFLVEGFVRALDGLGGGFPLGNVNAGTSPFNVVGYAFLLHIYSSPFAHAYQPPNDLPSRPDKHVVITIAIPLLQLTIFHMLSISKRLSTHRLLPTALTSMLSLTHFHLTLYSHFSKSPVVSTVPTATTTSEKAPRRSPYLGPNANYPLLNYIPNIFETFLLSTIFLTVLLNAIVQLLVRGRIDRIFSGLGLPTASQNDDDAQTGFFQSLPLEEDFGVLLLRIGTASLEATGLRGWGNEVAPIQLPRVKPFRRAQSSGRELDASTNTYGRVRMGRIGVGEVLYGSSAGVGASTSFTPHHDVPTASRRRLTNSNAIAGPTRQKQRRGLNNDVRTIDLGNASASNAGQQGSGASWRRWFIAIGQFFRVMWGVMKGIVIFLLERARGRVRVREQAAARKGRSAGVRSSRRDDNGETVEGDAIDDEVLQEQKRRDRETALYQRFLRGEEISDDEEYEDEARDGEEDVGEAREFSDDEDTPDDDDDEENGEREATEAVGLFTDLLRNVNGRQSSAEPSGNGEMVLAHLMHGSSGPSPGPLTRRRWRALVQRENGAEHVVRPADVFDDDGTWEPARGGRSIFDAHFDAEAEERDKQKGLQHVCVICTIETREIICWPCRCLAMCDNCREALASRSAPTKHRCPCCRQTVEGYSRIFIP